MAMAKKFIIVLGHESSGTRLVAETLARVTGYAYDDGEDRTDDQGHLVDSFLTRPIQKWWDHPETIVCDENRISRRSLPHGGLNSTELRRKLGFQTDGRLFVNPVPFINGLKRAGYEVYVVLTVRDRNIAIHSKCLSHTEGDLGLARHEMDKAIDLMNAVLENHDRCFVFSYEALMALQWPYLKRLYTFLDIQSDYMPELRDGNPKYLKPPIGSTKLRRKTRIGIVTRPDEAVNWGGDLRALNSVKEGLSAQGLDVRTGRTAGEVLDCNFVFLSNTCFDQRPNAQAARERNIPYGVIGFHEDFVTYYPISMGFTEYVSLCLQKLDDHGIQLRIEDLWENPHLANYYNHEAPKNALYNVPVLRDALFCLAASHVEARTMKRDCPSCRVEVVLWDVSLCADRVEAGDEFLKLTGLSSGEYILQVGRLETRKNELASVLATKDLDMPLVLIATKGYQPWYDLLVVNAAATYRKAPTLLISEEHPTQHVGGGMQIIQMPGGERLSEACMVSAYQHCGLHLHPAFWEAPGYTYLEAARVGVHTVASEWGALEDYCEYAGYDRFMGDRFTYVRPYDLLQIEQAVRENFGRKVDKNYTHPVFTRTKEDVGREIRQCLEKYLD